MQIAEDAEGAELRAATKYENIVSQSGTTHYINPNAQPYGNFKYSERRTTWCNMHLKEADAQPASGIICSNCTEEIKAWDERNRAPDPAEESEPKLQLVR